MLKPLSIAGACAALFMAAPLAAADSPYSTTIDLGGDKSLTLEFSGQHRSRALIKSPGTLAADTSNSFMDMRTRLGVKARFPFDMGFMFEIQDARTYGDEPRAASNAAANGGGQSLDVLQSYLFMNNLFDADLDLYLGRQKFVIGNQRLFSTLEFGNSRTWDGIRVNKGWDDFNFTAALLSLNNIAGASDDDWVAAAVLKYGNLKKNDFEAELLDIYNIQNATTDSREHWTSLRLAGVLEGFTISGEFVLQHGERGAMDVNAHAANVFVKYDYAINDQYTLTPMLHLDYASGDSDAADTDIETFTAPFPFGHKFNGTADVLGWTNIQDISLNVTLAKKGDWKLNVQFHNYTRLEDADGMYSNGGALLRGPDATADDAFGNEIDVQFDYTINEYASLQVAWAHFMAGDFIKDTAGAAGVDGDTDYIWAHLMFKF